jgi:hypothetical protein
MLPLPFPSQHPTASRHVSLYEPHAETLSMSQFRENAQKKKPLASIGRG